MKTIEVSKCKCGRDPMVVTRWQQKHCDPTTEIPAAYYIQCAFCGIETKVASCKKAKTPEERFDVIEKVAKEWNKKIAETH